ncbi:hypothetical protein LTR85_011900 [Meristemomyces frigidus]|nr:hypothetical protein LTR85_011900 [Meristemomyces frigidus]
MAASDLGTYDDLAMTTPASHRASIALSGAADRALTTYELLKQILGEASIVPLVHWRRVNRFWKEVIEDSVTLQQKLFLFAASPDTVPVLEWLSKSGSDDGGDEDDEEFEDDDGYRPCITRDPAQVMTDKPPRILKLHPLLESVEWARSRWNPGDLNFECDANALLRYAPGPWLRMFVSRPRVTELRLTCVTQSTEEEHVEVNIIDDEGITLGAVVAQLRHMFCREEYHDFAAGTVDNDEADNLWEASSRVGWAEELEINFGSEVDDFVDVSGAGPVKETVYGPVSGAQWLLMHTDFVTIEGAIEGCIADDSPWVEAALRMEERCGGE